MSQMGMNRIADAPSAIDLPDPPLPTFLIVGTMKSGTSTLRAHLGEHPDVHIPRRELHFFDRHDDPESDIDHYRMQFSDWSGESQIGEKTPNYALTPEGPQKIASVLPEAKLIWSFRNPVERAYSNYWHAVKRGTEFRSFDAVLKKETKKNRKLRPGRSYAMRSNYVDQINQFLDEFNQEQMYYILFEDMVSSPQKTLNGVFEFLGVDPMTITPEQHKHKTRLPKVKIAQFVARRILRDGKWFKTFARINRRETPGYPPMNTRSWEFLNKEFQTWYPEFERLTGLSTEKWRQIL